MRPAVIISIREERLSDDSLVFDVIMSGDGGPLTLPAISLKHATDLQQQIAAAIRANTNETVVEA